MCVFNIFLARHIKHLPAKSSSFLHAKNYCDIPSIWFHFIRLFDQMAYHLISIYVRMLIHKETVHKIWETINSIVAIYTCPLYLLLNYMHIEDTWLWFWGWSHCCSILSSITKLINSAHLIVCRWLSYCLLLMLYKTLWFILTA